MNLAYESMKGKTVIVTGASSGIGLAAALALGRSGASVVGVCRDRARADSALKVLKETACSQAEFELADLSSLKDVAALSKRILARHPVIHGLINNAGVFTSRPVMSADGIESQFATNHMAAFLLSRRLLPALEASGDGRIVCISSGSHVPGRIHWKNIALAPFYSGLAAYEQSKYANVLFIRALASRRAPGSCLKAYAVDPGLVDTAMGAKHADPLTKLFWNLRRKKGTSTEAGADTAVWLMTSDPAPDGDGYYWKERQRVPSSRRSLVPAEAQRLWDMSLELCARSGV